MKKTKKALLAALACSAALAGAVGLAACSGDKDTHDHKWGSWTVSTQPTNDATGKASRACTGEGTCDAAATEKEATLPVLTSTDYTKGEDTATCQAAGSITYTYNKGGVNVSFNVATPINAEKHTDTCGHNTPAPTTHSHVWSEWTVNESAKLGYIGEATRTCTGAGTCDADESLTVVTIPSVLWGEDYTYDTPVNKTKANCQTQGVDTYTYKDTENDIEVSFDVTTGYGDHKIADDECEFCHLSAVTAVLNDEVTINATSEKAVILVFTAEVAGKYRFTYTQGEDADINNNTAEFPAQVELEAGEKVFFDIKSPIDFEAPEQATSATYKIKVVPVTVLQAEYDAEDNLVGSTTVNVGGGKTAVLELIGKPGFDGTLTYEGSNSLTFSWSYYSYEYDQYIEDSFTLSEAEPTHVLAFAKLSVSYTFTVSSDAEAAVDEDLSILLEEQQEDLQIIPGGDDYAKDFEGIDFGGKIFYFEIGEGGTYSVTVRGLDVEAGKVYYEIRSDADDEESVIEANDDGSYTFESDTTYYILVAANESGDIVSGVISIDEYVALPIIEVGVAADVDNDGMENSLYKIEIAESGNYTISFTGFEATVVIVGVGTGYDGNYVNGDVNPDNGVYALEAGTYYISIMNDNYSDPMAWLPDPISGTITVSKV